jgi:hypothetical protein
MSKQIVAEVIALIELGMIAPEDIVKCLRKANSEPETAQPAPVQEPVAWMYEDMMGLVGVRVQKEKPIVARLVTPLYTTPPAQPEERNFCPRCGKRTRDLTTIHTCTPPQENT